MAKRKTVIETNSSSASLVPALAVAKLPRVSALKPTTRSIHAGSSTTHPARERRLTATPPTSSGHGLAKIGIRHSVRPVYPRLAKEEGWEGIVLLKFLVRTNGTPDHISVQRSSGHTILDKAAMDAIRQWRFTPAMDGNFPVEKYLQVPLKFALQQ